MKLNILSIFFIQSILFCQIIIDPGHGGRDPGCIGSYGTKESDINLKIALAIQKMDSSVVLTRDKDVFISLSNRIERKGDMFISIHQNSRQGDKKYLKVYVHTKSQDKDILLANEILRASLVVPLDIINRRGILKKDLFVLNNREIPSVLVECGSLSSEYEELINTEPIIKMYASIILQAVKSYKKDVSE